MTKEVVFTRLNIGYATAKIEGSELPLVEQKLDLEAEQVRAGYSLDQGRCFEYSAPDAEGIVELIITRALFPVVEKAGARWAA